MQPFSRKSLLRIVGLLFVLYAIVVGVLYFRQRSMLFFPTHRSLTTKLAPWSDGNRTIGYSHEVPNPRTIWLMMHGNGGQAAGKDYVLRHMSEHDSLYVLEYPGYGFREGSPSLVSMNQAASEAYQLLRLRNPGTPVCALGESLGSGPASALAGEKIPPDKIVLVVPFDTLASVASERFVYVPVRLILRDAWDNVKSLSHYTGPVDIIGAMEDKTIPIKHAKDLASQIPNAHFIAIPGGHGWANNKQVMIQR